MLTPNLITEPPIEWGKVGEVQTDKQPDKHTDKPTDKQTDKQTDMIPEEPEKEVPVITAAPTEDKTDLALPDHSAILQVTFSEMEDSVKLVSPYQKKVR